MGSHFSGPTGPSQKLAWEEPFTYEDRLRGAAIRVPSGDLFGRNQVGTICAVIAWTAPVAGFYFEHPAIVKLGASLAVLAIGAMGFVVMRDAARPRRPEGVRLTRQWRFGELARESTALYGANWRIFLGIGATYLPFGLLFITLQELIFRIPFLDVVSTLFAQERGAAILFALTYGEIQTFLAFVVILSVSAAALRRIDEGREPSVRASYSDALSRWRDIGLGLAKVFLIVGLVAVTVIGIPVAIWLTIRWYFVEHAVVVDDRTHRDARQHSARLVKGRWFKTLVRVLAITGIGGLAAPVLVAALLFFSDIPVVWANYVGLILHALILPLVAIALTLVYCDLRAGSMARGEAERHRRHSRDCLGQLAQDDPSCRLDEGEVREGLGEVAKVAPGGSVELLCIEAKRRGDAQ